MKITGLGEFGLIEKIRKSFKYGPEVIKGIGDDCAVVEFDRKRYMLLTCDMIIEGVDFLPAEKPFLVGRKALAVSISDIAACAGLPGYALVSMGLPKNTEVKYVEEIIKGMLSLSGKYKINIVGGDLSRSEKLVIDVSMTGFVEKKNLVLRNGAKKGDMIFVTGNLGGSIRGKHLRFGPRVEEARYLVRNFKVNSMIDISDGLLQDLGHILKDSKVGCLIYEGLLPVSKEARSLDEVLSMGEDFELLFTMSNREGRKLIKSNKDFTFIGEITQAKAGLTFVDNKGKEKKLKPAGFSHF
ncbi:MAG: thiamine-phosphate kinase [Candidatus Omnitrophica bacterium]|nr:thiamine-phosphate kinase [Candidatus Omnitrophota bacterium]